MVFDKERLVTGIHQVGDIEFLLDESAREQMHDACCRVEPDDFMRIIGVGLRAFARVGDRNSARIVNIFMRRLFISKLINDNAQVFKHYFGADIFPGSLNVNVSDPVTLQAELDNGKPTPSIVIPRSQLVNMPSYLGDGQAWPILLGGEKITEPVSCWIFRRVGSQVPKGVIEIIATEGLRPKFKLLHGDPVTMELL